MTFKEMYDGFAADKGKIDIKRSQLESKMVRKFKKAVKFPTLEIVEYTIPSSRNTYILYFYAESRHIAEKPVSDVLAVLFDNNRRFIVKWGLQPYKHTASDPMVATRIVNVYTSHFLQRYRERILKSPKMSVNEVACRYFMRNPNPPLMMKLNDEIMKNYQEYGETAGYGMRARDGICLTRISVQGCFDDESQRKTVDAIGHLYVTFIDDNTLSETQKEAVCEENVRYSNVLLETLMADL